MSFVENEAKRRKEAEQANTGSEYKHQETLKQILANEKQSALFAEYLTTEGREDLAEIVASGTFDEAGSDENELTHLRRGFLEIIERSDNVLETLDDQSLKELIAASPELTKIAERNGPEGIRNVIRSYLPKIAITDRNRFQDLSIYAMNIAERQEKGADINAEIKETFKDFDLNEKEIEKLVQGGSAREIAEDIRDKMGAVERFFGNKESQIATIKRRLENLASMSATDIKDYLDELGDDRRKLGDALGLALMENKVLHEALLVDLRSETIKGPEPEASFKGAKLEYEENMKSANEMWGKKRDVYRSRNEQDIYKYHQDEWLKDERERGWDEYYDEFLKNEFESELNHELVEQQFQEMVLRPYMDEYGVDSAAEIDPATLGELRKDFVPTNGLLEIDNARKSEMFMAFRIERYADTAQRKELRDAFLKTWTDPVPDATLKRKWQDTAREAAAVPMNTDLYENLNENFATEYVSKHMKSKGPRNGTWASIFGELFKKGLFELT